MRYRKVTILGSTGSIGRQALDVIAKNSDHIGVYALVCDNNIELLEEQARAFAPEVVVVHDKSRYKELSRRLKDLPNIQVLAGREAILEVSGSMDTDIVLTAIVGFAGLEPTIRAIKCGKMIALANKETLVVAGELIKHLAKVNASIILPVDSEHSAIYQCLMGERHSEIERLYLTASGGPFVDLKADELSEVTPEMALKHPNWDMGAKVTIDSSTLMNKGLEMIEAHHLFDLPPSKIEVLVHRQSIIHSMLGFQDGSIKAQLALPDMRGPIAYALCYPKRTPNGLALPRVDQMSQLTFEPPRIDDFPCLQLAYEAIERGGTVPCAMNAANEVAVRRFLKREIRFTEIPKVIRHTMEKTAERSASSLEVLNNIDTEARSIAQAWHRKLQSLF